MTFLSLPIPPWSYRAEQPSGYKQCSGNIRWNCEDHYKDLHPHLGTQWGSTAPRAPDLEIMLLKNIWHLLWTQTGFLQLHCKQHVDGCSSWPHEPKRNCNNAQGTKSKTGTLDTKNKSKSLLQKVFKLISRIVWKMTAVNINSFIAHSSSLSHLNWVQIYFPLYTYFSHMLNKCKYFTLSVF